MNVTSEKPQSVQKNRTHGIMNAADDTQPLAHWHQQLDTNFIRLLLVLAGFIFNKVTHH
jgi:hypothetical protein